MSLDILTIGEALVEIMRTDVDQPLHQPALFTGPYPSGAPFIFAVQAARLGLKTGVIGAVGQDAFGRCLIDQLIADDISLNGLHQIKDETTGIAFVSYNSDGSRDFVFSLGAGGKLTLEMVTPSLFEDLRCFHIMGSTLSMSEAVRDVCHHALDLARQNDARISFDPNLRPQMLPVDEARAAFAPFMEAAGIIIPTIEELQLLTGSATVDEGVDILLSQRDNRVIAVTLGKDGCDIYTSEGKFHAPGYTVMEVDPTGAGDCFDAGLLAGLLNGYELRDAAELANACGANAVTVKGPMSGAQPRAVIEQFIRDHRV